MPQPKLLVPGLWFVAGIGLVGAGLWFLSRRKPAKSASAIKDQGGASVAGGASAAAPAASSADQARKEAEHFTEEECRKKAMEHKNRGNKWFTGHQYRKAIECYTNAIDISPQTDADSLAVFHCNRAACYSSLDKYEEAVNDCNMALQLNKTYIKALNRRAFAYEKLVDREAALLDYTSACMLSRFSNEVATQSVDRLLKEIGKQKADDKMKQERGLPSKFFIETFMSSFPSTEKLSVPQSTDELSKKLANGKLSNQEKADLHSKRASKWTEEHKYDKALSDWQRAVELGTSYRAISQEQLGTYLHLQQNLEAALDCYNQALESKPATISVLIKRATLWFERREEDKSFQDFSEAINLNPNAADIFCHRGQVYMLQGNFQAAVTELQKSLQLDNSMSMAHIHLGFSHFKAAQSRNESTTQALEIFNKAEQLFPTHPDVFNFHGELLAEMQKFHEAIQKFDEAIEVGGNCCPLAYVNKAVLEFQFKQDVDKATKLCFQAIQVDPLCEAAYLHLAQLAMQQNELQSALEKYDQAIDLLRTPTELTDAYCCREAVAAQLKVQQNEDLKEPLQLLQAGA